MSAPSTQDPSTALAPSVARQVAMTWLGLFLLVGCLTVLFLCSRAVMEIGGSCASGGPYVIEDPCPQGVGWMLPLSIFAGLASVVLYIVGEFGLPGPSWAVLAWPALFLSLGWNFWEYGLRSGQGSNVGFVVCGVLFVLMGGAPLVAVLRSPTARRDLLWGDGEDPLPPPPTRREAIEMARPRSPRRPAADAGDATPELVDELERLTRLHRDGALSDDEFRRAKDRVIEGGEA